MEWASALFLAHDHAYFDDEEFESEIFDKEKLKELGEYADEKFDISTIELYKYENDRHRVLVAKIISDFFLFFLKHLL